MPISTPIPALIGAASPHFVNFYKGRHSTRVIYFNVRSLLPKIDDLRIICSLYLPDFVCIVETWLDPSIDDTEIFIQGYCVFRVDRSRHGGGVLVFVKDVFTCSLLYKGSSELELLVLSVNVSVGSSPDFCIALFYRPPSSDSVLLDSLFSTLCNIFTSLPCKFILLGDFNVDFLSPSILLCIISYYLLYLILISVKLCKNLPV